MTDAEVVRVIAQPITDHSDDWRCAEPKRREYAHALPKLARNRNTSPMDFARSAFGVRCVVASL